MRSGRNVLRNGLIAVSLASLPLAGASLVAHADTTGAQEVQLDKSEKEQHEKHHKKHGKHHGKKGGTLGMLTFFEMKNLTVATVAEMTGQSEEALKEAIKEEGFRNFMKSQEISRQALAGEMAPKVIAMVRAAESDGRLTGLQAQVLTQEIQERANAADEDGKKAHRGAFKDFVRMQYGNLTIATLAEQSGKGEAEVRQMVAELGPRLAGKSLGVEPEAFREAMKTKVKAIVDEALAEGSITADQAEALAERMEKMGKHDRDRG